MPRWKALVGPLWEEGRPWVPIDLKMVEVVTSGADVKSTMAVQVWSDRVKNESSSSLGLRGGGGGKESTSSDATAGIDLESSPDF